MYDRGVFWKKIRDVLGGEIRKNLGEVKNNFL